MSTTNAKQHQIINELYTQACADLLLAYGLTVDLREQVSSKGSHNKISYVSILGATGSGIGLSSVLKIDRDLVVGTHPLGCSDIPNDDLEDWCRELNNQLVGRLKNKLLGYDRVLNVGLPTLITGVDVGPVAAPNSEIHEYSVESAQGQIVLTLATLVSSDVELYQVESSAGEAVLLEGALALF